MQQRAKPVRIELQTSRTRKTRSSKPTRIAPPQLHTAKAKIDLTIKQKHCGTTDTVRGRTESSNKVQVTQFSLPDRGEQSTLLTDRQQSCSRWMSLHNQMSPQTVKLPQSRYITTQGEQLDRDDLINEISKRDKQVRFYSNVLQQRQQKHRAAKKEISNGHKSEIGIILGALSQELFRQQQLQRSLDELRSNRNYQLKRQWINRQGRMGMNYSRQQLSLLSGMSSIVPSSHRNSLTQWKAPADSAGSKASSQRDRVSLAYLLNFGEENQGMSRRISFNHS